ncbi:helicase-related protein [Promicromonospora sp. NPDC023987]|uniref:helicase-related protein n=1 Tax=Promicromonospora sp. NPDC023987 TaxID=3155360 RepID=UPI0033E73A31
MASSDQTFGYHPDFESLAAALDRGKFSRALVVGLAAERIFEAVASCRILWDPEVDLPEGLYWFQGLDNGDLLMQVGQGARPGDAAIRAIDNLPDADPLLAAWNWAEALWEVSKDIPAPRFRLHDSVITQPGGHDTVVRTRNYPGSEWSYSVVVDGRTEKVLESRLAPQEHDDDPQSWVQGIPTPAGRFGATLTRAKLRGKFANTLFSFRATRTTFRPYQFKPVLKLLQTGKARLLIADEVGLGKTIEAGLIWTELEARGEADRVLIVCPSGLVEKWRDEMADRFEFELTVLDNANLAQFLERHQSNRLPRRHAYIASLEKLRTWSGLEELGQHPPSFDLAIVDEAHAMRNSDTRSYALGSELAEWADNLVFLSATPINLRQTDLLNLLELIAPEDYGDLSDLEFRLEPNRIINTATARLGQKGVRGTQLLRDLERLRDTPLGALVMNRPDYPMLAELLSKNHMTPRDVVDAKRYLADFNTLSTVITRTKKVEVDDRKAKRSEDRQDVVWTPEEFAFYYEYVSWCQDRAREMDSPLYFAMQMPLRLASACLPMARRAVLDPEGFGDLRDADDGNSSAVRLAPHAALVKAARALPDGADTKFAALARVLRRLHGQERQALLFTHSRPTLAYLADRLGQNFRVAVMHGGVPREKRRTIMAEFRAGAYDFVLANRVASEGLDFEFCSAVINYDLPWNPMEIEQRIGRIDRIGQREETILVVNFVNDQTIDERILARLLERIEIFENSIGALEPIISQAAPQLLKVGFDFTLSPGQREQKVHEALTAIEEQRRGLQDVTDASSTLLVSNDVDVAGLEDDLLRTGRYVGQRELALLLDDWAHTDGAAPVTFAPDGMTAELRGNPAMATRVDALVQRQLRTRAETQALASGLRSELPVPLVLDQELARTKGGTLLTATSPLVMAAVSVPGHRHARFASLRVPGRDGETTPGLFVVVLAKAITGSRGGDEIWGAAVDVDGQRTDDAPVNALLAALAEGQFEDMPLPTIERLPRMTGRAVFMLERRHQTEQARRDQEFEALQQARLLTLEQQHHRKIATLDRRILTLVARGRGTRMVALFDAQKRRARDNYERLSTELQNAAPQSLHLEHIAACVVEVI